MTSTRRWGRRAPSSSPRRSGYVFEWFLRNKRVEWEEYRSQVTPYELAKYLPTL